MCKYEPLNAIKAHNWCFQRSQYAMSRHERIVVIDNTNITRAEYTPYVMLGRMYGYRIFLVNVVGTFDNVHDAPKEIVEKQRSAFEPPKDFDPPTISVYM